MLDVEIELHHIAGVNEPPVCRHRLAEKGIEALRIAGRILDPLRIRIVQSVLRSNSVVQGSEHLRAELPGRSPAAAHDLGQVRWNPKQAKGAANDCPGSKW